MCEPLSGRSLSESVKKTENLHWDATIMNVYDSNVDVVTYKNKTKKRIPLGLLSLILVYTHTHKDICIIHSLLGCHFHSMCSLETVKWWMSYRLLVEIHPYIWTKFDISISVNQCIWTFVWIFCIYVIFILLFARIFR